MESKLQSTAVTNVCVFCAHIIQVEIDYGVSWDDPVPLDRNEEVEVPEVTVSQNLNEDQVAELHHNLPFDPLDDDGNYGIEHYCSLLEFLATNPSFLQN